VLEALSSKTKMIVSKITSKFNTKINRRKVPYTKDQRCPKCGKAMKVRDSKKKGPVRTSSGEKVFYQVRRYICKSCSKIHTELPNELASYKWYETDAIQEAIDNGKNDGLCAEESTINRWRTIYFSKIVTEAFKSGIDVEMEKKKGGRWLAWVLQIIFSYNTKHTHFAFSPSAGAG
jgi:transposase